MKLLIFSDSHGNDDVIRRVLLMHHISADYALHAGDGAASFLLMQSQYPDVAFRAVRGNCDRWGILPSSNELTDELTFFADGKKILLIHGHTLAVKSSPYSLIPYARKNGVDIVVFGHTHDPYEKYIPEENSRSAVRLFNPGAARDGCYGIIEIRGDNVLMNATSIYRR